MLSRIFFCISLILPGCILLAQQAKPYAFTRYNTSNGLVSNFVNNVVQDRKGFMWAATSNGLQRYDGHRFITFKHFPDDPTSPPSDNITLLYKDPEDRMWVTTGDNKVGIFNTETFRYKEVPVRWTVQPTINFAKRFIKAKDGRLLLCMGYRGLYRLTDSGNSFVPDESIPVPPGWKRYDIKEDTFSNRFWMSCDSGLAVYNPASKKLSYRGHNEENDIIIHRFGNALFPFGINLADSGRFVFAIDRHGNPGLNIFNKKTHEYHTYDLSKELKIGYYEITGNLQQRNGRLWIFGTSFLTEYTGADEPFRLIKNEYRDEQSIKFNKVNAMYEDREKNLWISSDNGIFLFNPEAQQFNSYSLLHANDNRAIEGPVQTVIQLANGQYWIGSWENGLFCFDKNFNPVPLPSSLQLMNRTWSVGYMWRQTSTGMIWICLEEKFIVLYDPVTGKVSEVSAKVFEGQTVRSMTEDTQGNLWFGTYGGEILKWDRTLADNDVNKGYSVFRKTGEVHKMYTDKKGMVWAATNGEGLFRINPLTNDVKIYSKNDSSWQHLSSNAPYDIIQYDDSLFIIANGAVDVLNIKNNTIRTISTQTGLPSNDVLCLQKDDAGMVWLGMVNGLCRMNFRKNIFTYYDRRDGISDDNFITAGAYSLPNKKLLFATDHNFLVFDPSGLAQKYPPPDVKILDFRVDNKSLLVDSLRKLSKITLDYNKNSIGIDFGTLSYLRNNKKTFYYQLEKIDNDWIRSDDGHQVVYNYLPPGNYTFNVKCVNGYGIWSRNITKLVIYVQPPFWKTWWFYSMLLLLAVAVLYWVDRERVRRLLTLHQVRTQIAANLHQDINTTLNNINLLSEIAKIKADKDITKSKEYIDQINSKSRRMIDDMDDMLWSIDPQNDNMEKTIERMQEFAEGLRNTHGCTIQLVVDEKLKFIKLDMKARHEIFFIFKEALTNIIEHSKCTDSIINIDLVKSNLLIKIHDNGTGFAIKSLQNSNGIKEMQKRASKLNALLDIQSDKKGTAVILSVPI